MKYYSLCTSVYRKSNGGKYKVIKFEMKNWPNSMVNEGHYLCL